MHGRMIIGLALMFLTYTVGIGQTIPKNVTFRNLFGGQISIERPVFFAEVPGRDSHFVVLEQWRGIAAVAHRKAGVWIKDTLALAATLDTESEMGLLGLAFHPRYTVNRKFYLFYTRNTGLNVLEERTADSSLLHDAGTTPREILRVPKTSAFHNGGTIAFGADGFLYLGLGDGANDPQTAQKPDTLLGKILRINVDIPGSGTAYSIPSDNPFVGRSGYKPEIWAMGLRNPWRWSIDPVTGILWTGEVGAGSWEEINQISKGANFGWDVMEGNGCGPYSPNCNPTGMTAPIHAYPHTGGGDTTGACVIGGYVYRGNPNSPFYGLYFFGDGVTGRVWAMREAGGKKADLALVGTLGYGLSSFGIDSRGNLYVTSVGGSGSVNVLESPDLVPTSVRNLARVPVLDNFRRDGKTPSHDILGKRIDPKQRPLPSMFIP